MKNPKVSVIVPAYNEEKYLPKLLNALLKQDYENYEVIIVNNASTDGTADIVHTFIDSLKPEQQHSFKLYYEGQQGTNYAREKARINASGSIIAQLDADCIPVKNWISTGVKILQKSTTTVAATGPYYYFDDAWLIRTTTFLSQALTYPFINTIVQLTKRGAIIIGGNAFIKANILEKAGGFNTSLTFYGDDVDIAFRLATFGWIQYSNQLTQNTSARRYKSLGFWEVNKKYQKYFWNLIFKRSNTIEATFEINHPR
jgi:glycosyltransferase involved in cell wall biosynthesis